MLRTLLAGIISVFAISVSAPASNAQALLGSNIKQANNIDFISHFDFKEKQKVPGVSGITEHVFVSEGGGLLLGLGTLSDGRIVHMKFIMPRVLIDDAKNALAGRDLAKSLLQASITGPGDFVSVMPLVDEISVRDLDLHPVTIDAKAFADTGKPVPKNAYKIGSGPTKAGDRVMFLDKLPVLSKTPSEMYSVFAGRNESSGLINSNCRIAFQNIKEEGDSLFACDVWDEDFWQKNIESKKADAKGESVKNDPGACITRALELMSTKDPVQSRMAERELEQAEKLGSTDFRLPALKALASIQLGRRVKGLQSLNAAVSALAPDSGNAAFLKEMKADAQAVQKQLDSMPPSAVPAKERKYSIPQGTAAVIADRDESTGLVTLAISGGHDPDGGAQDGSDDGIIEMLWDNVNKPSEVYRAK